eukprot:4193674-Pyramimonas_sp.AAC.1
MGQRDTRQLGPRQRRGILATVNPRLHLCILHGRNHRVGARQHVHVAPARGPGAVLPGRDPHRVELAGGVGAEMHRLEEQAPVLQGLGLHGLHLVRVVQVHDPLVPHLLE